LLGVTASSIGNLLEIARVTGCYELRDGRAVVGFRDGWTCSSTHEGCGTRNNKDKRKFILDHLGSIEYRTLACATLEEAKKCELELKANRAVCKFPNVNVVILIYQAHRSSIRRFGLRSHAPASVCLSL
jgi:hypothetical protein